MVYIQVNTTLKNFSQGNLGGSYCLVYCGDGLESEITECLCGKFCKWTTGKPVCYDPADYEYSIYGEEYEQEPMPEAKVKNIFQFSDLFHRFIFHFPIFFANNLSEDANFPVDLNTYASGWSLGRP